MTQVTRKQHYAPSFYFKRFANEGWLQALNIPNGKVIKPQPYRSVCYGEFYYALETGRADELSQEFEAFFTSIEDYFSKDFDALIDAILTYQQLSQGQIDKLALFMACLWLRSPQMRARLNHMMEDGMKKMMQFAASHPSFMEQSREALEEENLDVSDAMIENAKSTFLNGDYDINFNNENHLHFISQCEEYFRWFRVKNWRFYLAKGSKRFITSDTPVIEIFNEGKTLMEKMYSNHIMQRRHFLALTPEILVELTDPRIGKPVKRKVVSDNDVTQYNLMRAMHSDNYCYGINRIDLEDLLPYYHGTPTIPTSQRSHSKDTGLA